MSIFLSILKHVVPFGDQRRINVLILHSIITILMMALVIFKFIKTNELSIKQLRYNKK